MKYSLWILAALTLSITPKDGAKSGRAGNEAYAEGEYEEAAGYYRQGLRQIENPAPGLVPHGLYNNLGSALYRLGDHEKATSAFAGALDLASSNAEFTRAAYNAGNNAFRAQNMEAALDFYRNALLADPNNVDAKFNYEFVKRQMQEQQNQQQDQQQDQNQDQQDQNQDQQDQNQDQQDQNQDQNQDQQQDQQQDQNQDQQDQNQDQQQPDPDELSREQAERILQALQTDEKELLRDVKKMKARPRKVEKDW